MESLTLNNSILDGNDSGFAFYTESAITSLSFSGSEFTNSDGISINGGSLSDHHINENIFSDNSHNLSASGEGTLDATLNYWGSADGPGSTVSGNVTVAPWYVDEALTSQVQQDCAGTWGGDFELDECGNCDNDSDNNCVCLLYTSPSPRDGLLSRMPSSA